MAEVPGVRLWLSAHEAARYVGRAEITLRDWSLAGIVRRRKHRDSWEYERSSLDYAKALMESNYARRRIVPGMGRGRWHSVNNGELF